MSVCRDIIVLTARKKNTLYLHESLRKIYGKADSNSDDKDTAYVFI